MFLSLLSIDIFVPITVYIPEPFASSPPSVIASDENGALADVNGKEDKQTIGLGNDLMGTAIFSVNAGTYYIGVVDGIAVKGLAVFLTVDFYILIACKNGKRFFEVVRVVVVAGVGRRKT